MSRFLTSHDNGIRAEYDILSTRVDTSCLFPMPEGDWENDEQLQVAYMAEQKSLLQREYRYAIREFIKQNAIKANRILSIPTESKAIGDDYYNDTPIHIGETFALLVDDKPTDEKINVLQIGVGDRQWSEKEPDMITTLIVDSDFEHESALTNQRFICVRR